MATELSKSGTVVVLLGPPGVGKGTQAVRLVDERSAVHVSTGDLLRAARREGTDLGRLAQGYMDRGELVPDRVILDLVKVHLSMIDHEVDVIFDGFPRTTDQAIGLDSVLQTVGRAIGIPDKEWNGAKKTIASLSVLVFLTIADTIFWAVVFLLF